MMHKVREPAVDLVLCIVTCGIYMYYLIYQFSREIGEFTGDNTINPTLEVVLSVITCGVYGIYWCYKYSKIIYEMQMNTGVQYPNDVSLPALILPIFGLTSVALLIMQTEINKVWIKSSGN